MRARAALVLIASLLGSGHAAAQPVVTSAAPDRLEVTVYRDPERGDGAMNIRWLNGFALISERRRVRLPAGESVVRFEGVAGGIVPQSAIVTGFPDGIVERNRDAYLLSPATLLDRSLGRRVHLRRTSRATGEVREQEAVVLSGAAGGVVLETPDGIESLRCTGLPEKIVYDGTPPGLSARPTLSVRTRSTGPVDADITLSYLATGFDWQSNYIVELSDDGGRMDLFAWLTLASQDETSFPNADTQAVAGDLNYTRAQVPPAEGGPLYLRCWPSATTSDIAPETSDVLPPAMAAPTYMSEEAIVVTGSRIRRNVARIVAVQEELGDLKLYRIPEPVTVAANSQKQVALLIRENVPIRTVYRSRIESGDNDRVGETRRVLVTRNRSQENLGVPLPSGRVAAFVQRAGAPFLIGEGRLADRAVGEDVEIEIGVSPGIRVRHQEVDRNDEEEWRDYALTVTSDRANAIRFEAEVLMSDSNRIVSPNLPERDGMRVWAVTVPANGSVTLRYRLQDN